MFSIQQLATKERGRAQYAKLSISYQAQVVMVNGRIHLGPQILEHS